MAMPQPDEASVSWIRFIFASTTVLGLMALLGWALKYFSMRGWIKAKQAEGRIEVMATFPLDARRRLVIAKCADIEYHLLLGPAQDLLLHQRPASPVSSLSSSPGSPS